MSFFSNSETSNPGGNSPMLLLLLPKLQHRPHPLLLKLNSINLIMNLLELPRVLIKLCHYLSSEKNRTHNHGKDCQNMPEVNLPLDLGHYFLFPGPPEGLVTVPRILDTPIGLGGATVFLISFACVIIGLRVVTVFFTVPPASSIRPLLRRTFI